MELLLAGLLIVWATEAIRRAVVADGAIEGEVDGTTTMVARVARGPLPDPASRVQGMRAPVLDRHHGGRCAERVSLVKNDTPKFIRSIVSCFGSI